MKWARLLFCWITFALRVKPGMFVTWSAPSHAHQTNGYTRSRAQKAGKVQQVQRFPFCITVIEYGSTPQTFSLEQCCNPAIKMQIRTPVPR